MLAGFPLLGPLCARNPSRSISYLIRELSKPPAAGASLLLSRVSRPWAINDHRRRLFVSYGGNSCCTTPRILHTMSNTSTNYSSPWRVLVAGGSYAGLAAALNLLDLCEGRLPRFNPAVERDSALRYKVPVEITIVDERDGYYHLIGSPLSLASEEYAAKAWVKFSDLPSLQHPGIKVIQGSVLSVDCEELSATISEHGTQKQQTLNYDYFIAASGLRRPWPVVPQSLTRDAYLLEAQKNIDAGKNSTDGVVVIGGGAVGVEMAAELKVVQPDTKVTLIHSRQQLLSAEPLPDEFKDAVAPIVRDAGVELILGQRVTSTEPSPSSSSPSTQTITLADGSTLQASHVIKAVSSSTPTTTYLDSTALDADGYVKIAPTLHFASDGAPHARQHFAVGDLAAWSGIKRCGAAMHMGHYAAFNLHQELVAHVNRDTAYKPKYLSLTVHPAMIGLAVGDKAVSYGPAEGVKQGEEVMKLMFGDDLGWSICWNYLRLGEKNPEPVKEEHGELSLDKLELVEPDALREMGEMGAAGSGSGNETAKLAVASAA